ncbi:MAG: DUF58 domain-containing protein [Lentisphaeria bacterium]|nr:DUF58 domain-containing protein [Lentisphaeria bacterium]
MSKSRQVLNIQEVQNYENLLVFAKSVVDGFYSGRHRAIHHGAAAQFKDFSPYYPGDDLKQIDWRLYAKTGKLFTRRYENETDMIAYLVVDVSASMAYHGTNEKFGITSKLAAALAYLMIHQGDKVALILVSDKLEGFIPPGGTHAHMMKIVRKLEEHRCKGKTNLGRALKSCQSMIKKRGRLVILSDFWEVHQPFFDAMDLFLHRNFDLFMMHVLHPDELKLPNLDRVRFVDMETRESIQLEPAEIRQAYMSEIEKFEIYLKQMCQARQIDYSIIKSDQPYQRALETYLGVRYGDDV